MICLGFNTTGDTVLTGSFDNTVAVWDAETGRYLSLSLSHSFMSHLKPLLNSFSRRKFTLIGHRAEISNAQFSYNSSLIATASMDQTAKLWDSRTGQVIS